MKAVPMPSESAVLLLVDNVDERREQLRHELQSGFWRIETTSSAGRALDRLADFTPDVILFGEHLADMEAQDFCRRIKGDSHLSSAPLVFLSSDPEALSELEKDPASCPDAHLIYPLNRQALVSTIRWLLRLRQVNRQTAGIVEQWRSMFDSIHDAVLLIRCDGIIARCNHAATRLVNAEYRDIVGAKWSQFAASIAEKDDHVLELAIGKIYTRRVLNTQKGKSCYRITFDPVQNDEAGGPGVVCIIADMTEREQLLHELRNQRQFLKQLIESSPIGIAVVRMPQSRLVFYNRSFQEITGRTGGNLFGVKIQEAFPDPGWMASPWAFDEVYRTGVPQCCAEVELRTGTLGELSWASFHYIPLKGTDGTVESILLFAEPVTQHVQARKRIEVLSAKLQAIIDSMTEGLVLANRETHTLSMNPAAARIHGLAGTEHESIRLEDYWSRFDCFDAEGKPIADDCCPLRGAMRGEELSSIELKLVNKQSGCSMICSFDVSQAKTNGLKLPLAIITVRDITERKRIEQEIQQMNAELARARDEAVLANDAKSSFLASVSHELRTPLSAIIGYSEMMEEMAQETGDTVYTADAGRIKKSALHLLAIINDVLDLSKVESGRMVLDLNWFEAGEIVNELAQLGKTLAERGHNCFEVENNIRHGKMFSDATKLKQILYNLVSNAAKFTQDGRIVVHCSDVMDGERRYLQFVVEDTGIGIPPEEIDRLFTPFHTIKRSDWTGELGSGLGLAITREFCNLLGGNVEVHTELRQGTAFTVRIPNEIAA